MNTYDPDYFNPYDPDFFKSCACGGSVIKNLHDWNTADFSKSNTIVPENFLGLGKKAKEFRLKKMEIRSQRRDNKNLSKERVELAKEDTNREQIASTERVKTAEIAANIQQQQAQQPNINSTLPQSLSQTPMSGIGSAGTGADYSDYINSMQSSAGVNSSMNDNTDSSIVKNNTQNTPKVKKKTSILTILVVVAVIVAVVYFAPKLLKGK